MRLALTEGGQGTAGGCISAIVVHSARDIVTARDALKWPLLLPILTLGFPASYYTCAFMSVVSSSGCNLRRRSAE